MGCYSFIKVMMILFNTLIFLGGGTLLGIGIWVAVDSKSFLNIFGSISADAAVQFVNVGYFLIAIGSLLVILGFLGCCGAQKESKCLLLIFFSIILIIFIAEIAGAVVALVYSNLAESILQPLLAPVLKNDYGRKDDVTRSWNMTMHDFKCCGFTGYSDFDGSYYLNQTRMYPSYCCNSNTSAVCSQAAAKTANVEGCFTSLLALIKQNAAIVGGVAAGICALELAAMVVSMYLYCQLDKGNSIH
ncbi:tetraspanin-1 [Bombina bombina]|uniref:tetraspanin-1 n=1 Tax=Bombina bombina TaxID=8345 RepID=UPI00235B06AA|nr:tetraspanin-1 [Bombina bombina]